jgi:diamine N-acetyltransferase
MTLVIRKTTTDDLADLASLWNDGAVMAHVGFPEGLGVDIPKMEKWLANLQSKKQAAHFVMRDQDGTFMGETYWGLRSDDGLAAMDIKLVPSAQGQGHGKTALSFAIDRAFDDTRVTRVYVDPHPENARAIRLYKSMGFQDKPRPACLDPFETYMEISKDDWTKRRPSRVRLVPVTRDNWLDVLRLKPAEKEPCFVAPNMFSLAQAAYETEYEPLAVTLDGRAIGFVMHGIDPDDGVAWIVRLMIDFREQRRGLGRIAMEQVMDRITHLHDPKRIRISFDPDNTVARALYGSMGFKDTGEVDSGETVYEHTR